jgi:hypothetical protein
VDAKASDDAASPASGKAASAKSKAAGSKSAAHHSGVGVVSYLAAAVSGGLMMLLC